jgi:hypothetical protein
MLVAGADPEKATARLEMYNGEELQYASDAKRGTANTYASLARAAFYDICDTNLGSVDCDLARHASCLSQEVLIDWFNEDEFGQAPGHSPAQQVSALVGVGIGVLGALLAVVFAARRGAFRPTTLSNESGALGRSSPNASVRDSSMHRSMHRSVHRSMHRSGHSETSPPSKCASSTDAHFSH